MKALSSFERFYEAVLTLQTAEECARFFTDVCTVKEMLAVSQRLEVAELLDEGQTFAEICTKTGASTTTISRVNRCLLYGEGGYREVLDRLPKRGADGAPQ